MGTHTMKTMKFLLGATLTRRPMYTMMLSKTVFRILLLSSSALIVQSSDTTGFLCDDLSCNGFAANFMVSGQNCPKCFEYKSCNRIAKKCRHCSKFITGDITQNCPECFAKHHAAVSAKTTKGLLSDRKYNYLQTDEKRAQYYAELT